MIKGCWCGVLILWCGRGLKGEEVRVEGWGGRFGEEGEENGGGGGRGGERVGGGGDGGG